MWRFGVLPQLISCIYLRLSLLSNNLNSTCVLIGLQVCFHSAMKHENDVSNVVWLSPSCEKLQFHERNQSIHVYELHISSFSLLNTENNFIKEIKHVILSFKAWWKPRQSLWELWDYVSGFQRSALEFSQTLASVFTRLWKHGEHVIFLKWHYVCMKRFGYSAGQL